MAGQLIPGLAAKVELTVADADTAQALGSGDVPVLGTPRAVALAEAATVVATTRSLSPGQTTVGVRVELDHKAATPIGRRVVAEAKLTEVDGRSLVFDVVIRDGQTVAAEGRVWRVLVDRQRFLEKVNE
jgi:predicted thioesterase